MSKQSDCPLCTTDGGALIWRGEKLRVIRAVEQGFPAFYRVVWTDHAAEFSDLNAADRALCMDAVAVVERVLREQLSPIKINLAALGNMVAHLHWHVIARYEWDSHFPASVWASAVRERDDAREAAVTQQLPAVDAVLQKALTLWAA
ncbi:HIT family protein [Comamonas sp. Y33R10-2]|uniref:HIT family protein n=1 Tax=Comamonas sp. Y33R10-2 TaxID=2853257 RepID=UPI001C5CBFC2|nr:HIT family protein [Comamonas sp. Y33R10-2]QXZ09928.1 HIT family protein [Comamonas sp. Y33R10-2]